MTQDPKTVLVTGTALVPDAASDYIRSRGYEVRHVRQDSFTADELHVALEGVSGYLIGGYEEPLAEHFERATSIEAVAWVGTDYKAYVPGWRRAYELGIAFLNSPGTNAVSVAEFTVMLALTMMRPFTQRIVTEHAETMDLSEPGRDLFQKRLGIIGLGRIGGRVARIAGLGFGMSVAYTGPRRNEAAEHALGVTFLPKDELLRTSDVISLHRPGPMSSDDVELAFSDLALLKEGALVINTAHHQLVDLDALLEVVRGNSVRAAFDGISTGEPWQQLIALGPERFLAVPSMAFNTADANLRASMRTAAAVCDILDGGTHSDVNNADFRSVRRKRS